MPPANVPADLAETTNETTAPILVDARVAGVLCGKSERTWRAWDSQGLIPAAIRIGRSTLWRVDELRDWVDAGCPERTIWHALRSSGS